MQTVKALLFFPPVLFRGGWGGQADRYRQRQGLMFSPEYIQLSESRFWYELEQTALEKAGIFFAGDS